MTFGGAAIPSMYFTSEWAQTLYNYKFCTCFFFTCEYCMCILPRRQCRG